LLKTGHELHHGIEVVRAGTGHIEQSFTASLLVVSADSEN
jgi:hypothetical protein